MATGFVPNFPPFQVQETKIQRIRTRSESELPNKISYGNRNTENRSGGFQQNACFKNKRTARDRVSWNSSNCWESYRSSGSHFERTRSRHQRRVTFNNGGKTTDCWLSSGFCIKHQPQDGNQGRKILISRERDFCEVLGNQYCKSCRKVGLRKECFEDFESTYMTVKRYQEPRPFTPFSDVVLCRYPAIPQSESRGLFNRLHELSSSSPEYFINYCEDPILSCSPTDANMSDSEVHEDTDNPLISTHGYSEDEEPFQGGEEKEVQFEKDTKHEPEVEETHSSETSTRKILSGGSTTRTSTPVTTGTTFLPELYLRKVKAKMQHILSSSTNTNEGNWVETFARKREGGSFREKPIEPPQITVDFAMGIFDPKKRQLHKKINYAAVVPHESL